MHVHRDRIILIMFHQKLGDILFLLGASSGRERGRRSHMWGLTRKFRQGLRRMDLVCGGPFSFSGVRWLKDWLCQA